jgi:hypothetical protein
MEQTTRDIAAAIVDGSIATKWWFYVVLVGMTGIGAAVGTLVTTLFTERVKGRISKEVWYAQESWREKYKLYMALLQKVDLVFHAAASIQCDARTLPLISTHASIEEGVRMFPDHNQAIEQQRNGMSEIITLSLGAELLLTKSANECIEALRSTYTRVTHVVNMSYHQRESSLAITAGKVKVELLEAAKQDLRV